MVKKSNIEKIGNISLNFSYYSGQDGYSDGDFVEERMLDIAKKISEHSEDDVQMQERYNQAILEEKDWAVLYHFSHIRGNIIEPVELNSSMQVLEIGSGCGAVTGRLAEKVKKVTCIELSKRRSLINAYKNCKHDNIEILVGNFQNMEKDLGKYDIITMIGVFEYAASYIQDAEPYRTFLQLVMKHLSPDGKLILAIENKLGMKYFAGCKEDHTGRLFEGIEGYTGEEGVRTFSKKELNELFMAAGFKNISYYYPYPDYKFPYAFYSDKRLPEACELFMNHWNFDRERFFLFDEMQAYHSVISAGLYGEFSNSFLVEAGCSEASLPEDHDQVIYKKCSNDRDFKYAVCTDIRQNQSGERKVIKYPMNDAEIGHLEHMCEMGEKQARIFEGSLLQICDSVYEDHKIVMEYMSGETLEKHLDDLICAGMVEKAKEELRCFIESIKSMATDKFHVTEEYKSFFGENYPESSMGCIPVTNIDLSPSNVFYEDGKWIVVDHEWSFDFPIPVEYVIYRSLFIFIHLRNMRKCLEIHDFFVFSPEEEAVFERMEREFQDSICRNILPLGKFYQVFGKEGYHPGVKIDELQKQVFLLNGEREELTGKITEKDQEKEGLIRELAKKDQEKEGLIQELARKDQEREVLHQKIVSLGKEIEILQKKQEEQEEVVELYEERTGELQEALEEMRIAYSVIANAACWKITAPVRCFLDRVKEVRFFALVIKGVRYLKDWGIRYTWKKVLYKWRNLPVRGKNPWSVYAPEALERQRGTVFSETVKISIVVPLYNTSKKFLCEMIESVQAQTYENWELCMADGSDVEHAEVKQICMQYAEKDKRIHYRKLKDNSGISENTNACLEMVTGDHIGLLDHDDLLHPAALYEVMCVICGQKADFIYTDEAVFHSPDRNKIIVRHFKPDFAPDNLRANNYICHFTVFSLTLLKQAGNFRKECDGSQDYDLFLRLTEKAKRIVHIPKILYFWRGHEDSTALNVEAKSYAAAAGMKAVCSHLQRLGIQGNVSRIQDHFIYRIRYEIKGQPKISILIPNYEHKKDLEKCLNSIFKKTTYPDFEILVIENNSKSEKIFSYYQEIQERWKNVKVITWKGEFNYSAINNYAVSFASGQYLLLLNNDTEVITADWLQEMLMFAQRQDVGAVGAKLYYPDNTVQHGGAILGIKGNAGHAHKGCPRDSLGYMGRLIYAQNLSAVTGACLMVRRDVWEETGGLDEKFAVGYNDVDFCLRIRNAGYLIVWTPFAELYHYESKSRGYDNTVRKKKRFEREILYFRKRWEKELLAGDPYYNPNLSLDREDFSIT